MTSEIMAVAINNQFFKIFLHGVPRRNFRFDLRKKTVLLLAEICAHSKASNSLLYGGQEYQSMQTQPIRICGTVFRAVSCCLHGYFLGVYTH